jgi:hypothetical protein
MDWLIALVLAACTVSNIALFVLWFIFRRPKYTYVNISEYTPLPEGYCLMLDAGRVNLDDVNDIWATKILMVQGDPQSAVKVVPMPKTRDARSAECKGVS